MAEFACNALELHGCACNVPMPMLDTESPSKAMQHPQLGRACLLPPLLAAYTADH